MSTTMDDRRTGSDLVPHPLTDEELSLLLDNETASAGAETAPSPDRQPPQGASAAENVGAQISGQRLTALWAEQSNRNAWAHFASAGWKRLSPLTDSGSTAMTLLAAHARAIGAAPVADESPAGTVSVMYVW